MGVFIIINNSYEKLKPTHSDIQYIAATLEEAEAEFKTLDEFCKSHPITDGDGLWVYEYELREYSLPYSYSSEITYTLIKRTNNFQNE